MNKNITLTCLLAGLMLTAAPFAQAQNATASTAEKSNVGYVAAADRKFFEQLAQANLAEVAAGEVARDKASDTNVQALAVHMVEDHGNAVKELSALAASKKNLSMPTGPSKAQQKQIDRLKAMSTVELNREYLNKNGVVAHQEALKLVKKIQTFALDEDIKAAAAKMQPVIEAHLKMAQDLNLK